MPSRSDILIKESQTSYSVGEYLEILLQNESRLSRDHEKIRSAAQTLEQLAPELLPNIATDFNINAFLLALQKKDKNIGNYYISLVQRYSHTLAKVEAKNSGNIHDIVSNLLNEASVITHPKNQIDRYFADTDYAFGCGIKCESQYKYIPDQSLQNLIQDVTRMRVAYLMTLIQLKTGKYSDLGTMYTKAGVYSRELCLNVLYHTLVANIGKNNDDSIIAQYKDIKKYIKRDIKKGVLQLPDRRLFKLNSLKKKLLIGKDLKKYFLNEKDFSHNNILKILTQYRENYDKLRDFVFPVVVVKDPITGNLLKVQVSHYGVQSTTLSEIKIPNLDTIVDQSLEDYVRKQLAKKLATNEHKSLNTAVAGILREAKIDSETIVAGVADKLRPAVYSASGWNRKLLFGMENFDPQKTVVGNIVSNVVSKSLLPVRIKEFIERSSNISGLTLFGVVGGFGLGGVPAAIALGTVAAVGRVLTKEQPFEKLMAKGFLAGAGLSFTKRDLAILEQNGQNPFGSMFGLITSKNPTFLGSFSSLFSKGAGIGLLNTLNRQGVKAAKGFNYGKGIAGDFANAALGKLGINGGYNALLRRSRENLEHLKNISTSGFDKSKRDDALMILGGMVKNASVFGYKNAVLAKEMLSGLSFGEKLGGSILSLLGFGALFLPLEVAKNSRKIASTGDSIFSFLGRGINKFGYAFGRNLGVFADRNGRAFVQRAGLALGGVTSALGTMALGNGNNVQKATRGAVASFGGLSLFIIFIMIFVSPILVAEKTAFGGRGSDNPLSVPSNLISCGGLTNDRIKYLSPVNGKDVEMETAAVILDVPYFNQVVADIGSPEALAADVNKSSRLVNKGKTYEIKGGGNMCGAASSVMVAGYYKRLPLNNSSTILQDYMYMDKGQNIGISCASTDRRGTGTQNDVNGAFAMISNGTCREAFWGGLEKYIREVIGLPISQIQGINSVQNIYNQVKQAIKAQNPLIMSIGAPLEHINVIVGYTHDGNDNVTGIVVNDPYADIEYDLKGGQKSVGRPGSPGARLSYGEGGTDRGAQRVVYHLDTPGFSVKAIWRLNVDSSQARYSCVPGGVTKPVEGEKIVSTVYQHQQNYTLSCEIASLAVALKSVNKVPAGASSTESNAVKSIEDILWKQMETKGYIYTKAPELFTDGANKGKIKSWGNPDEQFVGKKDGCGVSNTGGIVCGDPAEGGYGTHAPFIAKLAKDNGADAEVLKGKEENLARIYDAINNDKPVVIWIPTETKILASASDSEFNSFMQNRQNNLANFTWQSGSVTVKYIPHEHAAVLYGYKNVDGKKVLYMMDVDKNPGQTSNPDSKTVTSYKVEIPEERFKKLWSLLEYQAVIIK